MSFVKRAGLYCLRQRFKMLVLFLLLTLIATFMLTGIAIHDAFKEAAARVRTTVGGKILLETDTEGHMGGGRQNEWGTAYYYDGDLITEEIVDAIKKVDGVVDYNCEEAKSYYGAGVDFKYLPAALGLSYTPYGEASSYTATLSSKKCKAFQSGKYRLVDGRHITPDDIYTCLISKELADYNQLSVGDDVTMYCLDSDSKATFEIVGIFDGTKGVAGNALTVDEIPANCGYVDYAAVKDIFKGIFDEEGYYQLTIYVEDPACVQSVYDKISALPELEGKTLKLTIDTEEIDAISTPLESLQSLVNTAMILISVVSAGILTLLLTIWIRGRKREIGILLSIGKSKVNIILQLFTETFVVAVVSFAASMPFSDLVAERVSVFLLSRVAAGTAGLDVRVSAAYLVPLYLVGILLIAVSVLASSWTVVRLRPRDIFVS